MCKVVVLPVFNSLLFRRSRCHRRGIGKSLMTALKTLEDHEFFAQEITCG